MCPYTLVCYSMHGVINFPHIHRHCDAFQTHSMGLDVTAHRYVLNVNSSLDERLSSGISWVHLRENLILSVTLKHIIT